MSNFSGFISTLGLPYTQNDILSKITYSFYMGRVNIGNLLIQFGTTAVGPGNVNITLPVAYPNPTGAVTATGPNWTTPFIVFLTTAGENSVASVGTLPNNNGGFSNFSVNQYQNYYTYWMTIGPYAPDSSGN
jgi:hypothetical protein